MGVIVAMVASILVGVVALVILDRIRAGAAKVETSTVLILGAIVVGAVIVLAVISGPSGGQLAIWLLALVVVLIAAELALSGRRRRHH
jgi:hypothetical protein